MRRDVLVMLLLTAVVAGSAGCDRAAPPWRDGASRAPVSGDAAAAGTHARTITVDGRQRRYRVHVPASVAGRPGAPLVIVLHGGGGNGEYVERQTGMTAQADQAGFVVVYPDGSGTAADRLLTWNAGNCCAYARDHDIDDVAFIAAMIDSVVGEFGVDAGRVYAAGHSNGAMMAYRLACELSDRVAAIAAVSGAHNVDTCTPRRPVSVMIVHGTADQNVPYEGGERKVEGVPGAGTWVNRSVSYAVSFWTGHNGCPATPTTTRHDAVTVTAYGACAEGSEVALYTVDGGGHGWPGGAKLRDAADDPAPHPGATPVSWEFFARHRR